MVASEGLLLPSRSLSKVSAVVQSVAGPVPFTVMAETRKEYSVPRSRPGHKPAPFTDLKTSFSQQQLFRNENACEETTNVISCSVPLVWKQKYLNQMCNTGRNSGRKAGLIQEGSNERHAFSKKKKKQLAQAMKD